MLPEYKIDIYGPFDVTDRCERSVRPRGKKECALLAILALTPGFKRSRNWLKAHLWSERDDKQASASLRQTIWKVRKTFSETSPLLLADDDNIWLNASNVEISRQDVCSNLELLEGLHVNDEAFEDWLRENRLKSSKKQTHDNYVIKQTIPIQATIESSDFRFAGSTIRRPSLVIESFDGLQTSSERSVVESLLREELVSNIIAFDCVDVFDATDTHFTQNIVRSDGNYFCTDAVLRLAVIPGAKLIILVKMADSTTGQIVWSFNCQLNYQMFAANDFEDILRTANDISNGIHETLSKRFRSSSGQPFMYAAVHHFFSSSKCNQMEARTAFSIHQHDSGVACAWLAYSNVVAQAERMEKDDEGMYEHTKELCVRAIELAPFNPIVNAIVGHIHALYFKQLDVANDYLTNARLTGSNIALVWILSALHANYSNQTSKALKFSERARSLSRFSPHTFFFDTPHMIALFLNSRHKEAIEIGNRVLARQEGFLGVKRYMVGSLALSGQLKTARKMIEDVHSIDSRFNLDGIRDPRYPLPSKQSVDILTHAFRLTGAN